MGDARGPVPVVETGAPRPCGYSEGLTTEGLSAVAIWPAVCHNPASRRPAERAAVAAAECSGRTLFRPHVL